jgi:hypothetical protein
MTYRLRIAPHIYFLLLIIRGLSFSSSSSESSTILCSLARICCGNLLDRVRGHLLCCKHSFNFEVLSPKVNTSCTPTGTTCSGIYWIMLGKKCCIKISIINVEWQTSFFVSTLIIPIMALVWEVVHLINSSYSCLNKVYAQSIPFPYTIVWLILHFYYWNNKLYPFSKWLELM